MAEGDGVGMSSEAVSELPSVPAAAGSPTVFLSYASHDAEIANSVCQFLESHGVSCWIAMASMIASESRPLPTTPYF
jgi:hypothetical protein